MTQGASTNPAPLSYAPRSRRGGIWARQLAVVIALLAIVAAGWLCGPRVWRLAQIWYWQRQCMNFDPPAGTVAYESLPPGSAWPAIGPQYVRGDDPAIKILRGPMSVAMLRQSGPTPVEVWLAPKCWLRFMQVSRSNTWSPEPEASILFCHQRISPAGHVRLVVIQAPYDDIGQVFADSMPVYAYSPVNWHGTEDTLNQYYGASFSGQAILPPNRFFAGHPDPADASHFTIEYEWPDGTPGIIDGYLRSDDSVKLIVRPGPGDIASEEKRAFGP
jgi:hypothetical protein